ncbi:MAG: hypothetical protein V4636_13055 [Pseudomonadota bacterium]
MKYAILTVAVAALLCGCGSSKGGSSTPKAVPGDFSTVAGTWTAVCTDSWGSYDTVPEGTTATFEVSEAGYFDGLDESGNGIAVQLQDAKPSFIGLFYRADGSRHRVYLNPSTSVGSLSTVSGGPNGVCGWTITRIGGAG